MIPELNQATDYFSKEIIDKSDSIRFITSFENSIFQCSYTTCCEEFEAADKTELFDLQHHYFILNSVNLINLNPIYHQYGKYKKDKIFHVGIQKRFDMPIEYKKFDNIQKFAPLDNVDQDSQKDLLRYNMKYGMVSPTNTILEGNDYTYGVEIETCYGRVTNFNDLNLQCVYDGSLKDEDGKCYGGEYVTGVLRGDSGMLHLKTITNRLIESDCGVNHKCSIHVHVGNINWSKEQTIMAWALGCMLETELMTMMPQSRRNNEFCQLLKNKLSLQIDFEALKTLNKLDGEINTLNLYNSIYAIVVSKTSKMPNKNSNKMSDHPEGAKQRYNHSAQRYCWLNFVPLMFNVRNNVNARTLEFRLHSSTLNYKKMENWIKICIGFVNIIDNNLTLFKQGKIKTLEDVVMTAYPKTGKKLVEYIESRKLKFATNGNKSELDEYNEIVKINNGSLKDLICV